MDPFIGEIRIFSFDFAPQDWAYCNGQALPVAQNQALFSLISTFYGGSGSPPTQFNVPNLQSQVPMGANPMKDYDYNTLNQYGGAEKVQLNLGQLPAHTHTMGGERTPVPDNLLATPSSAALPNVVVVDSNIVKAFTASSPNTTLATVAISGVGANGTHENRQPFIALNFCICTSGVYPSFP